MKLVLVLSLFSIIGFSRDFSSYGKTISLEDLFHGVYEQVKEDWTKFELSAEIDSDYKSVLLDITDTDGLETMDYNTALSAEDFDNFMRDLFRTPYVVPHFCYNFKGLDDAALWELSDKEIRGLCKEKTQKLLSPLKRGDFVIRIFKFKGTNRNNNFYKAKIMAEDLKREKSVVINFDVVLD